jgi:hypothetical protein
VDIRWICSTYANCVKATLPDRRQKTPTEIMSDRNALRRWVLYGSWRDANYMNEPGRGPEAGLLGQWCDSLERIA